MDNKKRFTSRVDNYVKHRPTYPVEALNFLYEKLGFSADSVITDIGAGTGIFSRLLLERGSRVIGLEPNEAMRNAAMAASGGSERYSALPGSAEETGLPDASVDFIVCAQSYHWFDRKLAQAEFRRILKPGGKAVLIWNSRKSTGSSFLEGFERLLLTFGNDYVQVGHKSITLDTLRPYFTDGGPYLETFTNSQWLDEEGLKGRVLSSSYSPLEGEPNYSPMMAALQKLYRECEQNGKVELQYATELYWGEV